MQSQIKILVVGGCFPFQSNMLPDNLYHQILMNKLEELFSLKVWINILHYEKLYPTYGKIKNAIEQQTPDLIIFHIRTEQILRMIKFYFKYHDKNESFKRGFNVALFGNNIPEKESFNLHHISIEGNNSDRKRTNPFLVEINYLIGYLILNQLLSFKLYKNLINQISNLTNQKSIKIIFTGPVSRPTTFFENYTSTILNNYMKKLVSTKLSNPYLDLTGTYDNKQFLFCSDNIRVNELGHQRIANILFNSIKKTQNWSSELQIT